MTMYHGTLFYAVRSRNVGTFGGRAKSPTIKIYRSNDAGQPACTIDRTLKMVEFENLIAACGEDRSQRDTIMRAFVEFPG